MIHFRELGQIYKNIFVWFLVQMKTLKFSSEIYWPLAEVKIWPNSAFFHLKQDVFIISLLCMSLSSWKIKEKGTFFSSCLRSWLSIDLKGLDIFFCLEAKMKSFVTLFFGKIQGYKKIQVGSYSTWEIYQLAFHLNMTFLVASHFKIY